jgi:hypothetical protein
MPRDPLWRARRLCNPEPSQSLLRRQYDAHLAHVICDLPPKVMAAAMGHSLQTHLAAYSRWCGDDVVDDTFAKAERRFLGA